MYTTIAVIAGFAVLEQLSMGTSGQATYWVLRGIFWFALLIGTSSSDDIWIPTLMV